VTVLLKKVEGSFSFAKESTSLVCKKKSRYSKTPVQKRVEGSCSFATESRAKAVCKRKQRGISLWPKRVELSLAEESRATS